MKLAGVIFIVISTCSVGLRIASTLRKHCKMLRQLLSALQVMESEIGFCSTPLPQVFALMAIQTDGSLSRVFSSVARAMDKNRWLTPQSAMAKALQAETHSEMDKQVAEELLSLSAGLGKYDRESQIATLDKAKARIGLLLQSAEQECNVRSKTYRVLGICAGISVAILLV